VSNRIDHHFRTLFFTGRRCAPQLVSFSARPVLLITLCHAFFLFSDAAIAASPQCGDDANAAITAAREALEAANTSADNSSNEDLRSALTCVLIAVEIAQNHLTDLQEGEDAFRQIRLEKIGGPEPASHAR
jgi:hypothetical protein